jgi:hypothetical protein
VGKPEGKRPLGRLRSKWDDWIRMDLGKIGWGSVKWIQLVQNRDRWRALVNTVMNREYQTYVLVIFFILMKFDSFINFIKHNNQKEKVQNNTLRGILYNHFTMTMNRTFVSGRINSGIIGFVSIIHC